MSPLRVVLVTSLLHLGCAQEAPSSPTEVAAPAAAAANVVSVKTFGARGDGVTFDTAAIQAAVAAVTPGGTLHFPPGIYRIESDLGVRLKDDMRVDLGQATLVGRNVDGARCRLLEIRGGND